MTATQPRRDSWYSVRFWRLVKKTDGGCWLWTGSRTQYQYGTYHSWFSGKKFQSAHRYAYTITKGAIPEGLHIDHLCRVRHCVNPDHLEAVTPSENSRRAAEANRGTVIVRFPREDWVAADRVAYERRRELDEEIRKFVIRYGKGYRKPKGGKK